MSELKLDSKVRFTGEGVIIGRQVAGYPSRVQAVEIKTYTPQGNLQYIWVSADEVEEIVTTVQEFLQGVTPGTMFRNPRTGSEFVMLNGERYIRTKVGDAAKPNTRAGDSYAVNTKWHATNPNEFEVI